jgi:hypothetical protein
MPLKIKCYIIKFSGLAHCYDTGSSSNMPTLNMAIQFDADTAAKG